MSHRRSLGRLLERLDQRRLLSATLADGTLTITGTSGADSIRVSLDLTLINISDNGVLSSFKATKVARISASLLGGDDFIALSKKDGNGAVKIPATLSGGGGRDILRGGWRNDVLSGGDGNDSLDGNFGADVMDGGPGFDTADYSKRIGAVFIHPDSKPDDGELNEDDNVQCERVYGGEGDDTFKITSADKGNEFFGQKGTDTVDFSELISAGVDNIVNISLDDLKNDGKGDLDNIHSDIENVIGSSFADAIDGTKAANTLIGGAGNDTIMGELGNDFLAGGLGQDELDGGNNTEIAGTPDGLDTIVAVDPPVGNVADADSLGTGAKDDLISIDDDDSVSFFIIPTTDVNGTASADTIVVTQSASQITVQVNSQVTNYPLGTFFGIDGKGGNDTIVLSKSDGTKALTVPSTIFGGTGNDTIKGGAGADFISGEGGADVIDGRGGNDAISGGPGNDTLGGGTGDDLFIAGVGLPPGGSGNDEGGSGRDDMSGGRGNDTADYSLDTTSLIVTLDDNLANDGTSGELDNARSDIENVICGSGSDRIVGNTSANFLSGGPGNDSLRGGGGTDKLVGGAGKDTLLGNASTDLFVMGDAVKDQFDAELSATGSPIIDAISGDSKLDYSTTSLRTLG
jgi:Ca2+-binding RTX toxin-like protein